MTNPQPVARRRPTRARPRLPRGPKPVPQHNPPVRPSPGNSGADASSPPQPSEAPAVFDRNTARTLSVKEAAFRLNKSDDTILLWLRQGRLRGWQLGGRRCSVLVSEESVEQALLEAAQITGKIRLPRQP